MTEFADIYANDLTTDLFLWGSFALLVACFVAVIWLCRARERRASIRQGQAALERFSKTAAS